MSSLKNKDRHISDKPSIFRLLDLSVPQSPRLGSRPPTLFFCYSYCHFWKPKASYLISVAYSGPCQISKSRWLFLQNPKCFAGLWIWSPFWNKKVYSVEYNNEQEQFWTQIKDIQLDQPRTKQFSQNSWLSGVPVIMR